MGGIYSEGRFNGGFFALRVWGAYIWRGLYMEGLFFRNFTVCQGVFTDRFYFRYILEHLRENESSVPFMSALEI